MGNRALEWHAIGVENERSILGVLTATNSKKMPQQPRRILLVWDQWVWWCLEVGVVVSGGQVPVVLLGLIDGREEKACS